MALATNTSPGEIQLAGDLAGNNDATAPELTDLGIAAGQYEFPQLTVDAKGRITAIASGDPTVLSTLLPPASATSVGVVQAGVGLNITPFALAGHQEIQFSTSIDGTEATGLSACATYTLTISVDFAAPQELLITDVPITTINNVITVVNNLLIGATASIVAGNIRITSNTTGRNSFVEINNDGMFECIAGFVSINVSELGKASCEMNTDIASLTNTGLVQVGSGLSIDGAGLLTTAVATTTNLGTVQIGIGLTVDSGGILAADPIPDATTTTKGLVQIGTGISVLNGLISADNATNTTKGIVTSANPDNLTITAGRIDIGTDVALLGISNNWATAQVVAPSILISGAIVSVDAELSNTFTLTIDQAAQLENPINLAAGGKYSFVITQDATGGQTLSYDSAFKFKSGSDNTLSLAANAVDILTCVSNGTSLFCSLAKGFV